jgi:hypothetical protein
MKNRFDLGGYGAQVDRIVASSVDGAAESELTFEGLRARLAPRIEELCENLPSLHQLPDPLDVARLAPSVGGLLMLLQEIPTMRDIAEYTATPAADMVEVALHAFPNGRTAVSVGATDRITLREEFKPLESLASAGLHTHPSNRASGTDALGVSLHAARVPSPSDIDYARDIGPSAQYIADKFGVTYFTAPQSTTPAEVALSLEMMTSPGIQDASDASLESVYYPAAVSTISEIRSRSWSEIDPTVTLHDLISYSSAYTGGQIAADVFARSGTN